MDEVLELKTEVLKLASEVKRFEDNTAALIKYQNHLYTITNVWSTWLSRAVTEKGEK